MCASEAFVCLGCTRVLKLFTNLPSFFRLSLSQIIAIPQKTNEPQGELEFICKLLPQRINSNTPVAVKIQTTQ